MFENTKKLIVNMYRDNIVPGISYAIINDHKVYSSYIGYSQLVPKKVRLKFGQLYDLASLTKVIGTTTLVLKLIREGKLKLYEPICNKLPFFKDNKVTIFHLLTHTSGISGYIPNRNQLSAKELKKALLNLPISDSFEKRVIYTDIGFLYIGWIIENLLHKPIQKLIFKDVLVPLGMNNTTFQPSKYISVPTEITNKRGLIKGVVHDPKAYILKQNCASAGMFSNINDIIRFVQWYLGNLKIDNSPLKQWQIKSLFKDWTPNKLNRSLGWDIKYSPYDKHVLLYHTGFTGTFLIIDRLKKTGLIVLTNRIHPTSKNKIFLYKRDKIIQMFLLDNK